MLVEWVKLVYLLSIVQSLSIKLQLEKTGSDGDRQVMTVKEMRETKNRWHWLDTRWHWLDTMWHWLETRWHWLNTRWHCLDTRWHWLDTMWHWLDTRWHCLDTRWHCLDTRWHCLDTRWLISQVEAVAAVRRMVDEGRADVYQVVIRQSQQGCTTVLK